MTPLPSTRIADSGTSGHKDDIGVLTMTFICTWTQYCPKLRSASKHAAHFQTSIGDGQTPAARSTLFMHVLSITQQEETLRLTSHGPLATHPQHPNTCTESRKNKLPPRRHRRAGCLLLVHDDVLVLPTSCAAPRPRCVEQQPLCLGFLAQIAAFFH